MQDQKEIVLKNKDWIMQQIKSICALVETALEIGAGAGLSHSVSAAPA